MFRPGNERPYPRLGRALFVLLVACAACSNPEAAKREHLERGEGLLAQKRYQAAGLEFRSAQQLDEKLAAAYWGLCRAREGEGDLAGAVLALRRVIELEPDNLEAQVRLGNYALLARQLDAAGRIAEEALKKNPNYVPAHILLADAYVAAKQYDRALGELNRAVELEPQRPEPYLSLAAYYTTQDKPQQAEESYRRALSNDDRHAPAHVAYGNFLARGQRLAEAEAEFSRAAELRPDDPQFSYTLAGFYAATRQADKAEAIYRQVAERNADLPDAGAALAAFYAGSDRVDEAIRLYRETLGRWPDYDRGRFQLSEVLLAKSDFKGALDQVDEILKRDPNHALGLNARANIYLLTGRNDEAAEDAKRVLDQNPRATLALQFLADALLRAGRYSEARSAADRFALFYPDSPQALVLQAHATLWANEPKKAAEQAKAALGKFGEAGNAGPRAVLPALRAQLLTTSGLAKARLKNPKAALADMQAASALMPASTAGYTNLAYMTAGTNPGEALRLFEKALEFNSANLLALRGVVSLHLAQHQTAQAHACVDRLLDSHPDEAELHLLKAQVYRAESKPAEAERELLRAQEINPSHAATYYALAEVYIGLNQPERALGEFRKLVGRKQATAYTYTLMGTVEEGRGNFAAAVEDYCKALELEPQAPIAANNLAWLYASQGMGSLYEAARLARTAVDKQPDVANFLHTLGYVYLKLAMASQAVSQFRRAVALDRDNPTHHEKLSLALESSGAKDEAAREAKTAQRLRSMKRPGPAN